MPKPRRSVPKSVRFKAGPPAVSVIPRDMETWENCREALQEPSQREISSARQLAEKSLAEAEALERADARKVRHAPPAKPTARPVMKESRPTQRRDDSRVPPRRPVPARDAFPPQYSSSAPNPPYASRPYPPSAPRPHWAPRSPPTRAATDYKRFPSSYSFTNWEQQPSRDRRNKPAAAPDDLRKKALESAMGFGKVAMGRFQQMRDDQGWKDSFVKFKKKH